jgi:tRNA/rRNA methyltransferase
MSKPASKSNAWGTRFAVSVVEPEHGINLGYLARTAANFGIRDLIVVAPHPLDSEKLSDARLFAAHGRWLIDSMQYVRSFESLRKRFSLLIGTTAIEARRKSNLTRRSMSVESCALKFASRLQKSRTQDCFAFGRDSTGLTNDELKKCDYCVTIKTGSDYNTLNVSHAAAICFYEFSRQFSKSRGISNRTLKLKTDSTRNRLSTRSEQERAIKLFEKLGEDAEIKSYKMGLLQETLKRMFGRGDPSLRELYILMGLAAKASTKIQRLSKVSP